MGTEREMGVGTRKVSECSCSGDMGGKGKVAAASASLPDATVTADSSESS